MGRYPLQQLACLDRRAARCGIAKAGIGAIVWKGVLKTTAAILLSPMVGFLLALALVLAISWISCGKRL